MKDLKNANGNSSGVLEENSELKKQIAKLQNKLTDTETNL